MNDIALYKHIRECCHEIHDDGKCFVNPFKYEDFVKGLNVRFEQGFDACVCEGGSLCFDLRDVCDLFADNPDFVYYEIINDIALYKHIRECCYEIHDDGKCFVNPFKYEDFVKGLNVRFEQGFDACVCEGGSLCFDLRDVCDLFADNPDFVYEEIIKDIQ